MVNSMSSSSISSQISGIVQDLRTNFNTNKTFCLEWRKVQLQQLKRCLIENKEALFEALRTDLRQTQFLMMYEYNAVLSECDYMIKNLHKLSSHEVLSVPIAFVPAYARLVPEPYGLVLIISPWNYPVQLSLFPLVGAIAAGNAAVLKPSETSSATSEWFFANIPKYLDTSVFRVVLGSAKVIDCLMEHKWDYIFYTGNQGFAKSLCATAARNLTPVTTELGGKNATFIDETVNLQISLKRIIWAKFINCGQTCIAPDHIYVPNALLDSFLVKAKQILWDFYSSNPQNSPEYSRIVSKRHVDRLKSLIDENKGKVIFGGEVDCEDLYISPTIILNPSSDSRIMNEEIFGPILPIITYEDVDEPFERIRRHKALALYIFSTNGQVIERFSKFTSSGAVCINEALSQAVMRDVPFGGVGESGHGKYYGKYSFETFSHKKPIIYRYQLPDAEIRFPPYTLFGIRSLLSLLNYPIPSMKKVLGLSLAGLLVVGLVFNRWPY